MVLRTLVRSNYGGKSPVSIKYENVHSFKEGVILLWQSSLETRRISHLPGSTHFTIPLKNQPTRAAWKKIFPKFGNIIKRVCTLIHYSKLTKLLKWSPSMSFFSNPSYEARSYWEYFQQRRETDCKISSA